MADGPTVVNSGGSGGGWAVGIIAIIVLLAVGFFVLTQGNWGGSRDIDVKIEAPSAPAAPAAPTTAAPEPAAPAPAAPAPAPSAPAAPAPAAPAQ